MDPSIVSNDFVVRDKEELRRLYGEPVDLVKRKVLARLDGHCARFIALSPLVFIATAETDGRCDVSAHGDAPGFVKLLDDRHLAVPDRPGNNRLDALSNIVENGHAGLVFVIPGRDETLRVNGSAAVVVAPDLLAGMAVGSKRPRAAILIEIEEAFLHCGLAFRRGIIWDPARFLTAGALPGFAAMLADHTRPDQMEQAMIDQSTRAPLY